MGKTSSPQETTFPVLRLSVSHEVTYNKLKAKKLNACPFVPLAQECPNKFDNMVAFLTTFYCFGTTVLTTCSNFLNSTQEKSVLTASTYCLMMEIKIIMFIFLLEVLVGNDIFIKPFETQQKNL